MFYRFITNFWILPLGSQVLWFQGRAFLNRFHILKFLSTLGYQLSNTIIYTFLAIALGIKLLSLRFHAVSSNSKDSNAYQNLKKKNSFCEAFEAMYLCNINF